MRQSLMLVMADTFACLANPINVARFARKVVVGLIAALIECADHAFSQLF